MIHDTIHAKIYGTKTRSYTISVYMTSIMLDNYTYVFFCRAWTYIKLFFEHSCIFNYRSLLDITWALGVYLSGTNLLMFDIWNRGGKMP